MPVHGADQLTNGDRQGIRNAFDELYEHRYAHHSPDEPVEMVNIRLAGVGKRQKLKFPKLSGRTATKLGAAARCLPQRRAQGGVAARSISAPILAPATRINGPALIEEHGTTTVLFERDSCTVARSGELLIEVGGAK